MSFDLYQVEKVAFNTSQTRRASLKCSWAKVPPAAAQGQLDFPKKISLPFVKTLFSYFLYFLKTLFGGRKAEICRRKSLGGRQPIRGSIFSEKFFFFSSYTPSCSLSACVLMRLFHMHVSCNVLIL